MIEEAAKDTVFAGTSIDRMAGGNIGFFVRPVSLAYGIDVFQFFLQRSATG